MRLPLSSSARSSRLPNHRSRHFISHHPVQLTALVLMAALLAAAIGGPITGAAPLSFTAKQDFATGTAPRSVTVGDLNGDGKLDLAVANQNSSTVSVLLNTTAPGAAIPTFAAKQDFATGSGPSSVTVGDHRACERRHGVHPVAQSRGAGRSRLSSGDGSSRRPVRDRGHDRRRDHAAWFIRRHAHL